MNKKVTYYERILKSMIEKRNGQYEDWLEPQLHSAAMCWQMLEKVHEELMKGKLVEPKQGSKDQWYNEVNPLMPTYKELQRTMIQHYQALGLNYNSTPSKMTETVKPGGGEKDKLSNLLDDINNIK